MSSPNHPTFKIEDAFSSNFPDYVSASPDYFLVSPGNTSPDFSNDFTKTSISTVAAMTPAAIRQLIVDGIDAALEEQAATMANTDNSNRNTRPRETLVAKRGNYKDLISC
uniref:Reverse transcriptase domain-containing protein n=1 Tax=Tanacetum cinerariifolium TaxID=118510 RepID=A0A6L2MZ93_TANCI|nr:hypothetical protein [Tanacetum cinerariifolium]